jgi:hypothetical protein
MGKLGLTSRRACYADALVNGALVSVPGYNATKTVASLVGFNFNPVQFVNGNTGPTTGFNSGASPFAAGSPTGPQLAAGVASVTCPPKTAQIEIRFEIRGKDEQEQSYGSAEP